MTNILIMSYAEFTMGLLAALSFLSGSAAQQAILL